MLIPARRHHSVFIVHLFDRLHGDATIVMRVACAVMLLASAVVAVSPAQTDSLHAVESSPLLSRVGNDGLTALKAMGHVLGAPSRWDGGDWLIAGGIAGGTVLSALLDDETSRLMKRNHSPFNEDVTAVVVEYGSGYVAIGLPVALYIAGFALEDTWTRETAVLMGSTLLLTSAITTVGKVAIGRARPYAGFGNHEFRSFNGHEDFMSFPSGHTTAAFAVSAVLAARIRNPWASAGLYGVATAAAASRMYTRDHWLSDVVFTAAYTTAVAHSVVKWFEKGNEDDAHAFNIVPTMDGVRVVLRF
jgi:membrane-associated phospholipid phosphatase